MNKISNLKLVRQNLRLVKQVYPDLTEGNLRSLRELTRTLGLSVSMGEIQYIDARWYVTHSGLIRIAQRKRCVGISTVLQERQSDPVANRWVFRATVYKSRRSRGFVGYGEAEPSNVSPLVRGAELRVAETRAVNRALRKAYGIGLCSVDELGWSPKPPGTDQRNQASSSTVGNNGHHNNGQPRLRDQLCLLIRQYNLDPTLVKAYAAEFCGTQTLKGASRDLVESFISHLSSSAIEDLDGLVCKLNSYSHPTEVKQ